MHELPEGLAAHFSDCAVIVKENVSVNSQKMLASSLLKNKQKTKQNSGDLFEKKKQTLLL